MKKMIFLTILFFIFLFSSYIFYYQFEVQTLTKQIYTQKSNDIKTLFRDEVKKKFGRTAALTYLISQDKKLLNALKLNNKDLIDYSNDIKKIQDYGDYKNLWIQVIDKNGYSFYRSWTKKVGDNSALARIDVVDMLKNPRPMQSISTGRFDMTFKTAQPLFDGDEFLGMVEVISKFNSISINLQKKSIEPLMLAHESYTKRFINPFTGLFIGRNYVANMSANKELMKKVEKEGLEKFIHINNYLIDGQYLVTFDQIKDVHGGEMGYFIFFFKEKDIDKSIISDFKVKYTINVIIFLVIYILLILYLLNRNYAKQLNKEVKKQTSKINEQKEELKSLLNIYDTNVIFSKTNLKGIITHVSSAFCKISGYEAHELIGKPHNIVRHPDMPSYIFNQMWESLKKGQKFKGEIKNLKKDGGYYWVDAEVSPEYDKDNNIIGFVAVREDITANKDVEEIQKEIIFAIGSIGEARSKETGNHVKRVAEYSKVLALAYGLDEDEAEMLRQASPMHDIGKIAIPDEILHKPAKLTSQEFEIMKTHAIKGHEILNVSNRPLLKTAAIVALTHHEKYDGTGYPNGLKADEIHLYGRITAITDVFDALGSERCYKKAWELDKIKELFEKEKGKQFDPNLVELFFKNLDKILKIRDEYKDIY